MATAKKAVAKKPAAKAAPAAKPVAQEKAANRFISEAIAEAHQATLDAQAREAELKAAEAKTLIHDIKEVVKLFELKAYQIFPNATEAAGTTATTKTPTAAKYAYVDAFGHNKTWTGKGKMPDAMKEAIADKTKTLDDFLIEKKS